MADLVAIRAAIASQVAANALPSLSTSAEYSNPINPPMLLVFPRPPAVKFGITLGEGQLDAGGRPLSPTEFTFKGALVVAKADLMSNVQDYLDQWLGFANTTTNVTVAMAIAMDPTLGGAVEFCETRIVSGYGPIDWGGVQYFGATFEWEVSAR